MAPAKDLAGLRRASTQAWKSVQIELNGQYSIKRMEALRAYCERTSIPHALAVILLTPVPCLLIIVLADSIPLAAPTAGPDKNVAFWLRLTLTVLIFCFAMIEQLHGILSPELPITRRPVFKIIGFISALSVLAMYGLARVIGFPIPFMCWTVSMIWAPLLLIAMAFAWRKHLWGKERHSKRVAGNFRACVVIAVSQMCLISTYPAYFYVFNQLPSKAQTVFSLGLPLIKMLTKNVMSRSMRGLDDHKPEMVTLTVEIFHALFVSYCTQVSISAYTVGMLIGVDVVHSILSLHDVLSLLPRRDDQKTPHTAPKIESDTAAKTTDASTRSPAPARTASTPQIIPTTSSVDVVAGSVVTPSNDTDEKGAVQSREDRKMLQTLRVLYLTEFLVLIEYIEVIIPCIYSLYLILMPRLPNSVYYPQLATMTTDSVLRTIGNLLLYACLELLSFLTLDRILTRRLQIAPIHQLAFVLEGNWKMVQSKIIPWVFFLAQSSLVHYGVDYSFEFQWLRKPTPTP